MKSFIYPCDLNLVLDMEYKTGLTTASVHVTSEAPMAKSEVELAVIGRVQESLEEEEFVSFYVDDRYVAFRSSVVASFNVIVKEVERIN